MGVGNMAKIIIQKNQQFVIAPALEKEDFFLEAYEQAFTQLNYMTQALAKIESTENDFSRKMPNNVLAFDGQRGQGKTSAMLTFTGFFKKGDNYDNELLAKYNLDNCEFEVLDPIDPSSFEQHHTVLRVVVAQMYQRFEKMYTAQNTSQSPDRSEFDAGKVLEAFQTVYEGLALVQDEKKAMALLGQYEGSLEQISRAGDSTSLATHFRDLVDWFLALKKSKGFLVIPIDDLDLSLNYVHNLTEEIRKYLAVPNVIVVMAVRIDQLKEGLRAHFSQHLKDWPPVLSQNESLQMAEKYLTKLLPISHRISLPKVADQAAQGFDRTVLAFPESEQGGEERELVGKEGIQTVLLELIWQKTGLILLRTFDTGHPIVPNTLREMVQLLTLLQYDMSNLESPAQAYGGKGEAEAHTQEYEAQRHNLELFMTYFTTVWVHNALTPEQCDIVETVWQANTADRKFLLCDQLLLFIEKNEENTRMPCSRDDLGPIYDRAIEIISGRESSLGSVNTLLNSVEYIFPDQHTRSMVFALRTILSATMLNLLLDELLGSSLKVPQNKLYNFVGNEIWGERVQYERQEKLEQKAVYDLTRRRDQMIRVDRTGHSRICFSASLPDMLRDERIAPPFDSTVLSDTNRLATSELTAAHWQKLTYFALIGRPKNAGSMVAGNNTVQRDYVVDLESLFLSALYPACLPTRIGGINFWTEEQPTTQGKAKFDGLTRVFEEMSKQLNRPLITAIITNVDLARAVAEYLEQTRNRREKIDAFEGYILDFFRRLGSFFSIDQTNESLQTRKIPYVLNLLPQTQDTPHELNFSLRLFKEENGTLETILSQCMDIANRHRIIKGNSAAPSSEQAFDGPPFIETVPNSRAAGRATSLQTWKDKWEQMWSGELAGYSESTCKKITDLLTQGQKILNAHEGATVIDAQRKELKTITEQLRALAAEAEVE